MSNKILKEILNLRTNKEDLIRLGSAHDGGYVVNKSSLDKSDVLYTYGVSDDYNFELDYAKRYPDKEVRMFDHTVNHASEVFRNVFFFKEALEINDDDTLNSFRNHLERFKDLNKKVFLKIDIEGYEYDFFLNLSNNLDLLNNITGMAIEFHNLNTVFNYILFHKIINKLSRFFTVTHIHGNNHARQHQIDGDIYPEVIELSFCKKELAKDFILSSLEYPLEGLDSPCHRGLPDHKIVL